VKSVQLLRHGLLRSLLPCLILPWISSAGAATCEFERQPVPALPPAGSTPAIPELEPYALVRVRGAEKDRPLSVTFGASASVWFHWRRFTTGGKPDLRQRVEIDRQPAGSKTFESFCDAAWTPLSQLPAFGRLKLDGSTAAQWRIRVYQDNLTPTVSILDEDLSEIAIAGRLDTDVKVDPAPLAYFDFLRLPPDRRTPTCDTGIAGAPSDAELVRAVELPREALNVAGSIHALSGRHLYLKVGRLDAGRPVSVSVNVKPISFAMPDVPVCTIRLTEEVRDPGQWYRATFPGEIVGDTLRWTVTLFGAPLSPAMDLQLYRDRSPSQKTVADTRGADVYSCTQTSRIVERDGSYDTGASFRAAYALTVRTGLRELGVTGDVHRQVVDAMLSAINNWRVACTRCAPYQFSVIDVDGDVYVPQDMLAGTPENHRATFAKRYPWNNRISITKNNGLFTSAIPFVKVSGTPRQRQRFCNQHSEPNHRFSAADSPLCRPSVVSNEDEMIINVEWHRGAGPCGSKPGAVACWNGTDLIKMNLREFAFYAGDVGAILLGSSPRQVDLIRVFTHEVGHWLGLPHLSPDGNIMAYHFSEARCIDDVALTKLNAIASGLELPSNEAESLLYDR